MIIIWRVGLRYDQYTGFGVLVRYTLSLCRGHSWRVRLAKQETLIPPGTWSHLSFAEVRECPPCCSIVGATVTMHQFFCILHIGGIGWIRVGHSGRRRMIKKILRNVA